MVCRGEGMGGGDGGGGGGGLSMLLGWVPFFLFSLFLYAIC